MRKRLIKIRPHLKKDNLDGLLVSSPINIGYLTACLPASQRGEPASQRGEPTRQGFFGFSKDEREAYLLIMPLFGYLLTDGRYIEAVKKTVQDFEVIEISSNNPATKLIKEIVKREKIKRLGFEKNNLTVGELEKFNDLNHFTKVVPTINIVEEIRTIKEPQEITTIESACRLGDKAFDYILGKIKPGVTEKQLAFEIEYFIKRTGADISFPPIVAFGKNSSVPHHQTSETILGSSTRPSTLSSGPKGFTRSGREGQIILLDFGVKINNYCSDMTRVVFFGKASREQKKIYNTVLTAQQKAINFLTKLTKVTPLLRCNLNARQVDEIARDYIIKAGFPTIPHSLGHGVGLEVHELPRLGPKSPPRAGQPLAEKDILKPGMVFSLEPGIYLPGVGGIRIEDLVVLEKSGPRILTGAPKEIIEL